MKSMNFFLEVFKLLSGDLEAYTYYSSVELFYMYLRRSCYEPSTHDQDKAFPRRPGSFSQKFEDHFVGHQKVPLNFPQSLSLKIGELSLNDLEATVTRWNGFCRNIRQLLPEYDGESPRNSGKFC